VTSTGVYNVAFRVASAPGGGQIQLRSGATTLTTVNVPATGGWQTWTTINTSVNLSSGSQTLRVFAATGGWNFNWVEFALSGSNTAPSISISSPANNTSFTATANITINATASDTDGTIMQVQFYNGVTLLGTDTSAPYSFIWSNVAAGTYSITARATDNGGLTTTSTAIGVTVTGGGTVNLALNKTTEVLSIENGGTPGAAAVDGNAGTRWSSAAADPQWIYVDLGANHNVNRVKITWETALGKDYQVQIATSTTGTWTTLKTITGNTTLINDHTGLSGSGRFVRIYGTARGTGWGYSIWELEVYGTSAAREATSQTELEKDVPFYPNPVDDIVSVNGLKDGSQITIRTAEGGETFKTKLNNGSIDIGHLPSGFYIMDYHDGVKPVRYKLIKR
jgi:hypothetical protein